MCYYRESFAYFRKGGFTGRHTQQCEENLIFIYLYGGNKKCFYIIFAAVSVALLTALFNYYKVKRRDSGTNEMKQIAAAIQEGASAFIWHEYKIIIIVCAIVAAVFAALIGWYVAVAFIVGALMSATAGYVGMKIATISNVRVSNEARTTKDLGATLKVAFQGGSVMGLSVGGFAILGLGLVFLVFGKFMGQFRYCKPYRRDKLGGSKLHTFCYDSVRLRVGLFSYSHV